MSLKKNIVSNFILTASTILFPLITLPYITRTLSAVNIGKVFYIDSFTQYFILFSAIGIPYYGVREVAKIKDDAHKVSQFVMELVTIQFALSLVFSGVFLCLHLFFDSLKGTVNLINIGCIAIIANSFLIEWFYQGIENFSYITKRSLIIKTCSVLAILSLVIEKNDFELYYIITSVTVLANAILNFGNFLKNHYRGMSLRYDMFRHLRPLWVLFSINVSVSLYTIMDTIILGSLTNVEQVSFYNIPLKIVKIFWTVMGGIGIVLIPRMSTFYVKREYKEIEILIKKSINIVLLLGIPFLFMCIIFAEEILLIISGKQYLESKLALQILSVVPLIIGLCNVFGTQFLLAIGQEKRILIATIFGFCVSLLLNFLLIPFLGFIGASISCVLAELTVCVIVFLGARKYSKINIDMGIIGLIFSSVASALAIWMVSRAFIHDYVLLAITAISYLAAFMLLQLLVFKNEFVQSILKFGLNK